LSLDFATDLPQRRDGTVDRSSLVFELRDDLS